MNEDAKAMLNPRFREIEAEKRAAAEAARAEAKAKAAKETTRALTWAGGILVLTLGAVIAHRLGYIDRETVIRVCIGPTGLCVAWFGNRIPKTFFVRNSQARQAQRVAAWSQVLSGLVYAGLWAFAPIPVAIWGGGGVILAGAAVTIGYARSMSAKVKAAT